VLVSRVNVSMPKGIAQAELAREIEYDLRIGTALAARRDYGLSQLHERLRLNTEATGKTTSAISAVGFMNKSACA
jgi:hypothetical protein